MDTLFEIDLQKFINNSDEQGQEYNLSGVIGYNHVKVPVKVSIEAYKVEDDVYGRVNIDTTVPETCVRCLKTNQVDKNYTATWKLFSEDSKSMKIDIAPLIQEELYLNEDYYPKCKEGYEVSNK